MSGDTKKESRPVKHSRKKRAEEFEKVIELIENAQLYEKANDVRLFIAAIEAKMINNELGQLEYTKEWIEWARQKADWLDPTIYGIDDDEEFIWSDKEKMACVFGLKAKSHDVYRAWHQKQMADFIIKTYRSD